MLGRDATAILDRVHRMRGAVHLRMIGDVEDRIDRAAETYGISRDLAAQRQVREDRMRTRMSRHLMHWESTDDGRYHLIIDTSRMPLDEAVEEFVAAVEAEREMIELDRREEPEGPEGAGSD